MAQSGNHGNTFRTGYRVQVEWEATPSIPQNNNVVTAKVYLVSLGSSYNINASATKNGSVNIGGTNYSFTFNATLKGNQKKLIGEASRTITHNSDGTRKFALSASAGIEVTLGGTYFGTVNTGSKEYTLDTIPRTSTLISNANFNIGASKTINISRASSSFTHTVRIYVGGTLIKTITGVGTSITWTPTTTEINNMYTKTPNSNTVATKIEVDTISGGTVIGTDEKTGTATVTNSNPTFTTFNYLDTNSTTTAVTGDNQVIIQGKSNLRVTIPAVNRAVAVNGATMIRYQVTVGKTTKTITWSSTSVRNIDFGNIDTDGNITISVRAIDSRGNSTTRSRVIVVVPYSNPTVDFKEISRSIGEDGTDPLAIKLSGYISPLTVSGTRKNEITYIRYRVYKNGTTAPSFTTISTSTLTYSGERYNVPVRNTNVDTQDVYIIEVGIRDKLNTTYITFSYLIQVSLPPIIFDYGTGDIHFKGALIQTGDDKVISETGGNINRYNAPAGSGLAGIRALKLGDNTFGSSGFPAVQGFWAYFQSATADGDFALFTPRTSNREELYFSKNNGSNKFVDWYKFAMAKTPQEFTATLGNGWTGTLKYFKDDLGYVTLYGTAEAGTITGNTVIATLPSGYRPLARTVIPVYDTARGRVYNAFAINTAGVIMIPPYLDQYLQSTARTQFSINFYSGV